MKKHVIAAVAAATFVTTAMAGCTGADTTAGGESVNGEPSVLQTEAVMDSTELSGDAAEDDGKVTLTVWAEEANFDVLQEMIDSFEQKYAGQADFDIQLAENADAETRNTLLGDVHNGADVFPLPDDQLTSMVAAGALEQVPNADEIREANLDEAVAAASVNDTLYAYPMTADNGYFLYYDKNYLTEEDVQTMDGLLAAAGAVGKKVTMDWSSGWYLYAFFGNTGLDFGVNDDGVTNYCDWNATEGSIKGTDIEEALLAIAQNPAFLSCTDTEFMEGVQDGTVVAGVSGVWNASEIKKVWGNDYGGGDRFRLKPAAVVISARRAGTTATWDQVNKYFGLMQMPIITSRYWNMVHGTNPDEVKQDLEGMQVMQILGNNMAYFINCKNVATKMGIEMPKAPDFVFTNFIR